MQNVSFYAVQDINPVYFYHVASYSDSVGKEYIYFFSQCPP